MKKLFLLSVLIAGLFSAAHATITVAGTRTAVTGMNGTVYIICKGKEDVCATIYTKSGGGVEVELKESGSIRTLHGEGYQVIEGEVFGIPVSRLVITGVK